VRKYTNVLLLRRQVIWKNYLSAQNHILFNTAYAVSTHPYLKFKLKMVFVWAAVFRQGCLCYNFINDVTIDHERVSWINSTDSCHWSRGNRLEKISMLSTILAIIVHDISCIYGNMRHYQHPLVTIGNRLPTWKVRWVFVFPQIIHHYSYRKFRLKMVFVWAAVFRQRCLC
jgi:hypothetical protein